jgi:anti-sigma factor RsiW
MIALRRDPLRCQQFVELITDYLEGALPRRERRRLEAHLRDCHGCQAYLDQMRLTIRGLADLPPAPVDPHVRETLLTAFRDLRG